MKYNEQHRTFFKLNGDGGATAVTVKELRQGDYFKIVYEYSDHPPTESYYIAKSDPYKNKEEVWTIEAEPVVAQA